jgi:hypothetical protein
MCAANLPRGAWRDKMPSREMSKRTGLSRNMIRKYLRAGAVASKLTRPTSSETLQSWSWGMKVVFVHAYHRFRLGRWEFVCAHWRSLPA